MNHADPDAASILFAGVVDLNDLLLDHPAASFIFELSSDLAIVDRVTVPDKGNLVVVGLSNTEFAVESYNGQEIFGVVIYLIHRTH